MASYGPVTKRYWALWDSLKVHSGVLYRKWESDDGKSFRLQLVVPRSRVENVLEELHSSPSGGHFGVMKTTHKVRERFYWDKLKSDVDKWCRTCSTCTARKGQTPAPVGGCNVTTWELPSKE
ncbi:hypothetical protein JTE90_023754 [Oedothorax gibbosus]|uniref:RNA-directed DNA polymerase n=1 Tax=Oedothorax gibbosus TaxID=931172 RepID=A0AAV6TNG6_9ARAC|nr:hypothetical protein JTE90_023754 [Oedothorax gibbosus]